MRARRSVRQLLELTAILAASLMSGPWASAATVSVRGSDDGHLLFVAEAGETNDVAIAAVGDTRMRISDAGAVITPGPHCTSIDTHDAVCRGLGPDPIFYEAILALGDLDDHLASSEDVAVTADGGAGNDVLNGSLLRGSDGDDELYGTDTYDELRGGSGNDLLRARGRGADDLFGGAGDDRLFGGSDHIYGDDLDGGGGQDQLYGSPGDDTLTDGDQDGTGAEAAPGPDVLEGGAGSDTLDYARRGHAVTVHLGVDGQAGEAGELDSIRGIENVTGGAGDDLLVGDGRANVLVGDGGDDFLNGRGGNDVLSGGAGVDALGCGGGRDRVVEPQLRERPSRACELGTMGFPCRRSCGTGELWVNLQPKRERRNGLRFRLLCPFVGEDLVIGCRGTITLREMLAPHRILGRGRFRHNRRGSLEFPASVRLTRTGSMWWAGRMGSTYATVSLRVRAQRTPRRPFKWRIRPPGRS